MAMKIEELIEAMVEARLRKIKIDEELAAHMVDRSIAEVKQ